MNFGAGFMGGGGGYNLSSTATSGPARQSSPFNSSGFGGDISFQPLQSSGGINLQDPMTAAIVAGVVLIGGALILRAVK